MSEKYNVKIKLSFLKVVHTQNELDSIHSMIEKNCKGKKLIPLD